MSTGATHSVSVSAVVANDRGQVLMIRRRDNGHWEPPGGVLEADESIGDGLRREVREETGLSIEPERLTGVYKNMRRGIVALVFRANVLGSDTVRVDGDEVDRVAWISTDEISDHCDEAYAVRVLDALRGGPVAVRAHDGVHLLADA